LETERRNIADGVSTMLDSGRVLGMRYSISVFPCNVIINDRGEVEDVLFGVFERRDFRSV
jgi:hypothetical protein